MRPDVMIDLETLDTRPSAVVLSIGACLVNWRLGEPTHDFYRVVDLASAREAGLTESPSTKAWWDRQSAEAKRVFTDPCVSLEQALLDFDSYLEQFDKKEVRLWGNGSDFDNVILANAYDAIGFDAPWRFYNNRCYRTAKNLFQDQIKEPFREGTHHNALDDAKHQARGLLSLKQHICQGYTGLKSAH